MKSIYQGTAALERIASIAASSKAIAGVVNLRYLSKLCVTARVLFASNPDTDTTINLHYSPDGKTFDTIAFGSITVVKSSAAVVQASKLFDVPQTGWMQIEVSNGDTSLAITNVAAWASIAVQFETDRQLTPGT